MLRKRHLKTFLETLIGYEANIFCSGICYGLSVALKVLCTACKSLKVLTEVTENIKTKSITTVSKERVIVCTVVGIISMIFRKYRYSRMLNACLLVLISLYGRINVS